jgi:hypothetical protein
VVSKALFDVAAWTVGTRNTPTIKPIPSFVFMQTILHKGNGPVTHCEF